jgi:hypothetical protein
MSFLRYLRCVSVSLDCPFLIAPSVFSNENVKTHNMTTTKNRKDEQNGPHQKTGMNSGAREG